VKAYFDSSVILRWLLKQPRALNDWSRWQAGVISELLEVEVLRSLDRLRLLGKLTTADMVEKIGLLRVFVGDCDVFPIQHPVLQRASSSFPTVVGTLDAIHLSTALLWMADNSEPLVFLTHDRQLALAARACGMEVKP
jgi:predicted nucleic acid-binding protein